jgi:ABC-type sugar transport systems, ATPase components
VACIELKNVGKSFAKTAVIENMNLKIEDGSFTVLVGPSGCGKTTLLRMIAGIGPQTSGQVLIDGKDVTDIAPGKREVAMVFQNYAIYPTMNVRANIEFGLKNNKVPKEKRDRLINEICDIVGLKDYLDRKPSTLSGGQRQRVALARAMVKQPKVFLMDEPLSNLDAKLRVQMRVELIELHKKLGTTFVYVTHDQVEAMSMADKIVLMNKGKIQQEAAPEAIYRDPNNMFTAQFIGTPPMNIMNAGTEDIKVGFRPERIMLSSQAGEQGFSFKGRINTREMLGSETIYSVSNDTSLFMVKSSDDSFRVGQEIYAQINRKDLYLFDKEEQRIREGDPNYESYMKMLGGK